MRRVAGAAMAAMLMAGTASAEPVKVGMITTLSGGGAGLGIDVRDGFVLALKQAEGNEIELSSRTTSRSPTSRCSWPTR